MKQISFNKKYINFDNIKNWANEEKFPKLCNFCGEIFEFSLEFKYIYGNMIRCPICFCSYYVVYNDLNEFTYLEFSNVPEYTNLGVFSLL